jgi:FkbM family methyltransferase
VLAHCDIVMSRRMGCVVGHAYLLRDLARLSPRSSEPKMSAVFCALLERYECGCFVDVGANLGGYSWLVANRHPAAKLLLFEPDAKNLRLLRKTIVRSGLARAELNDVALSDRSGSATFIVDDASGAAGSIVDQRGSVYNLQDSYGLTIERTVETRRLDQFFETLAGLRVVMKVDVEGAEPLVFAGATRVLAEIRPVIFFESFKGAGFEQLRRADYRIYSIGEQANYLALPAELEALASGLAVVDCADRQSLNAT